MKITEMQEVDRYICDICGKEASEWNACARCHRNFCNAHANHELIKYSAYVFTSGYLDRYLCISCDMKDDSKLHKAYKEIANLRRESEDHNKSFEKRKEAAENALKDLL